MENMIEWFIQFNPAVQAAMIAGAATIIGAIIKGIFDLISNACSKRKSKGHAKEKRIKIKQSTKGNENTIIGIQISNEEIDDHE